MSDERQVAQELFGSVKPIVPTGDHRVNLSKLSEALKEPDVVIPVFCTGCGYTTGLTQIGLDDVLSSNGLTESDSLKDHYFEVTGCPLCQGEYINPDLKKR